MAKRQSLFVDLAVIAARLPWWAGILLALISFVVMHLLAGMSITPPNRIQGLGNSVLQIVAKTFGMFAQFILPILFLIGAGISASQRPKGDTRPARSSGSFDQYLQSNNMDEREGRRTVSETTKSDIRSYPVWRTASTDVKSESKVDTTRWSVDLLAALEWKRFEEVCAGLFARLGFETKAATHGADGGIDIYLYQPPSNLAVAVVQCKSWTNKVGVNVVRELRGVMAAEGVGEGIFVTTSTYSDDAIAFASANHIDLMDGKAVLKAILRLPEEKQRSLLGLATSGDFTTPTCASCGVKMVSRKPKLGGKPFWGCVNYPKCRTKLYQADA